MKMSICLHNARDRFWIMWTSLSATESFITNWTCWKTCRCSRKLLERFGTLTWQSWNMRQNLSSILLDLSLRASLNIITFIWIFTITENLKIAQKYWFLCRLSNIWEPHGDKCQTIFFLLNSVLKCKSVPASLFSRKWALKDRSFRFTF